MSGGTPNKSVQSYWSHGTIPWVSPKDFKTLYMYGDEDFITEKALEDSSTKLVPINTILVVFRSGVLQHTFPVAIATREMAINQDLKALVFGENVLPYYALYYFNTFGNSLLPLITKHSTTVQSINTEQFSRLAFPIPPKDVQQSIIDIMGAVYETKKVKEEKAKELLDSIDTYLLNELGITLPSYPSNSLDERVFEIDFEDIFGRRLDGLSHKPFYENAVDAIKKSSKNYSYALLRDLITHSISGDWGDDEKNITNFDDYTQCLVLRSTEIDNTYGLNIDGERKKYRYLKNTKLDRLNTRVNDILVEKSGGSPDQPVGRVALLTQEIFKNDVIAFSNFIHKIRLDEKIQAEFAFNCLRTFYNKKITENMQSQTNGIRNLIMSEFLHIPIPLPEYEIQKQISKEIKRCRDDAKKLQTEAKELLGQAKKEVEKIILGENK